MYWVHRQFKPLTVFLVCQRASATTLNIGAIEQVGHVTEPDIQSRQSGAEHSTYGGDVLINRRICRFRIGESQPGLREWQVLNGDEREQKMI